MTDEMDQKITVRSVVRIVGAAVAVTGMWTTLVLGQQDSARRLTSIERHVAAIDSSMAVARVVFQTRAEVQELLRQSDSTHAAIRARVSQLEERLGRF